MAYATITGSAIGTKLTSLLLADDIMPGVDASYELCKLIYLYHPLGAKISDKPLELAQSQDRNIAIADAPDEVLEAFLKEWNDIKANDHIFNVASTSRIYGIASIAMLIEGEDTNTPIDLKNLWRLTISFNCYDPLNTAGSLVLNQNVLAMDFQHVTDIRVSGATFHRSRTCVIMNERPIYIAYTPSAFGFVGRSVYQRALYPLKSFIQTMRADDMVARKAGVIVAMIKQAGTMIDNAMKWAFGQKRSVVKEAETDNVISIGDSEKIESLNLQNLEGPLKVARTDILENIASAVPMPAKLMTEEALANSFSEGSEDAKQIARYIDRVRLQLRPLYAYFDRIVMHRAWNPEFFARMQKKYPKDFAGKTFEQAKYEWINNFIAVWPSLLKEPDSEISKVEKVKLEGLISAVELLLPHMKEENKKILIMWLADNFNTYKQLFENPLTLDFEEGFNETAPQQQTPNLEQGGAAGDGEFEGRSDAALIKWFQSKLDDEKLARLDKEFKKAA